ncbi:MAG: hypothetical protein IPP73_17920 [Chitinophagaceae bacterium]|nr:hypothetical protein [Chitinophagaceae bacterium]
MSYSKMDRSVFKASRLEDSGNADYQYWFDKSIAERLAAAAVMIAVSFREPDFLSKRLTVKFFLPVNRIIQAIMKTFPRRKNEQFIYQRPAPYVVLRESPKYFCPI